MAVTISYVPEKLIEANRKLRQMLPFREEPDASDSAEKIKTLIERLYRRHGSLDRASALALSDRETDMLAGYLPYNYLEVDESRLFGILGFRMDGKSGEILFREWQESFHNEQCNSFIRYLVSANEAFQAVLKSHHIEKDVFLTILDSPNIPLSFDEILVGRHFADGDDFNEKLLYYGVREESFLDMECKRALLTFCGKADYFSCSEDNILDIIGTYDSFMLKKFLLNFMSKMSLAELQAYPKIAATLRNCIGHRKSETFLQFFRDTEPEQIQQYLDWINLYKINMYFNNDERSRFWKQYRYLNVIKYPSANIVILEFDRHIAVEFLGTRKGTVYICEKEVFRETFYDKMETMSNEDLRIYFKLHKDSCIECRNHSGRWQMHLDNVIQREHIAEKVRF